MSIKKAAAAIAGSAVVLASMIPASAEAGSEVTVYGTAGISFQVRDSWEHRDQVGMELLDESGTIPFDADLTDVRITGNGSYEVSLTGWWCEFEEAQMGWIALDTDIPVEKVTTDDGEYYAFKDYPDATIKIDSYTEDGTDYDLSEAEIGVEDNGKGFAMVKVANGWADPVVDARGRDCLPWVTTDPVVIKFTVSGLPNDKVADYADEVIEFKSGNGAPAADAEDSSESSEESSEVSSAPESSAADSSAAAPSSAADTAAEEDNGPGIMLFVGIGAAAVVLIAVIIVIIVKKK